jgi:hypothetical protein
MRRSDGSQHYLNEIMEQQMNPAETHRQPRRIFMRNGIALLAAGSVPALLSGCATAGRYAAQDDHAASVITAGDEWAYDELNGYARERVAQLRYVAEQGSPPSLRLEVAGKPLSGVRSEQHEEYDAAWVVARDTVYDTENRYDPPLPLLPALLEPGAHENWQSMVTNDDTSRPRRWHVQIDALQTEQVTVPAGTFEALRVRRLIKFEHPDFFRSHSERVDTLWYSPQVKRWVKREWQGQYLQKMRSRIPYFREDWIIWELTAFRVA